MPRTQTQSVEQTKSIPHQKAVRARWDAVKEDRAQFIAPFHDLPVADALSYLENLRKICEEGGHILNDRIGADKNIRCSGPRCGKDLSQLQPNGNPRWIAKKDFHDRVHPEIIRSLYFCSELCHNEFVRKSQGSLGSDGK